MVDPVVTPTVADTAAKAADKTVDVVKKESGGFFSGLMAPFHLVGNMVSGVFGNLWGVGKWALGIFGLSNVAGQEVVAGIPKVGSMIADDMRKDGQFAGSAKDAVLLSAGGNAAWAGVKSVGNDLTGNGIGGAIGTVASLGAVAFVAMNIMNKKDVQFTGNSDTGTKNPSYTPPTPPTPNHMS